MTEQTISILGLTPLIIVAVTALLAMALDLMSKPNPNRQNNFTIGGLLLAALSTIPVQMQIRTTGQPFVYWSGIAHIDTLSVIFTALACLTGALVLMFSIDYLQNKRAYPGEFITLVPFVVLGLAVACSTCELLTFFLAFELMSLPLYLMAAWGRFDLKSSEAGFKYFINGAVASAIMFYGISLIFGTVGSTFFDQIICGFENAAMPRHAFVLGCLMFLVALLFKIAVAPFHFWAPDVYEGAPAPAALFISTAPKATIIAFLGRVFWGTLALQSMEFRLTEVWVIIFCSLAIISMCWGNLAALKQTNIKRLMAYSGVAQIGYTMLGVMTASRNGSAELGLSAAIFYICLYCFANMAVWAVIAAVEHQRHTAEIADYQGLAKTNPFLAFTLLLALFSLAGAPPLAGFLGKFFLFRAVFWSYSGWWWVVLIALINSVISLYYYFGILRPVYFADSSAAQTEEKDPLTVSWNLKIGLTVCLVMITVAGFCPSLLHLGAEAGKQILNSNLLLH